METIEELLDEIQAICIGADSPDAIEHGERDPIEELQCCREDISAISVNVEKILEELKQIEEKQWNHEIKATDTAKDLAFAICDIYANEESKKQAIDTILELCNKITKE